MTTRRSSAANPNDFAHPYLNTTTPLPKKREFGLRSLFFVKMCGCFSVDELPPPNFEAPIYQAGKSSSSNLTFQTNTTTSPTTSRTHSPPKDILYSSALSTSTNTTSRASGHHPMFTGSTGVEDIPYRRPPPTSTKSADVSYKPNSASSEKITPHRNGARTRIVDSWESRAPIELAETDEVETRNMVGNVSRLSAMFEHT